MELFDLAHYVSYFPAKFTLDSMSIFLIVTKLVLTCIINIILERFSTSLQALVTQCKYRLECSWKIEPTFSPYA